MPSNEKAATRATTVDPDKPKRFNVGDKVWIPCHNGKYLGEIMGVYDNLEKAREGFDQLGKGRFDQVLQAPFGPPEPNQIFYYCELARPTARKPLGVAHDAATFHSKADAPKA